jgi:hypothetical protein
MERSDHSERQAARGRIVRVTALVFAWTTVTAFVFGAAYLSTIEVLSDRGSRAVWRVAGRVWRPVWAAARRSSRGRSVVIDSENAGNVSVVDCDAGGCRGCQIVARRLGRAQCARRFSLRRSARVPSVPDAETSLESRGGIGNRGRLRVVGLGRTTQQGPTNMVDAMAQPINSWLAMGVSTSVVIGLVYWRHLKTGTDPVEG